MKNVIFALALAIVATFAAVNAGQGVSALTPTPSNTPATAVTTSTVTPPGFTDAAAVRDELLGIARENLSEMARANFNGFFFAWGTPYPGIAAAGYLVPATPDRVSTWYTSLVPKAEGSPANPTIVAFAVADTSGGCAGAVLYGYPKTDMVQTLDAVSPCTAQGVVDAFELTFATPAPVTTVPITVTPPPSKVPLPPNTGTGITGSLNGDYWLASLGFGVLVLGLGLALRTRRTA